MNTSKNMHVFLGIIDENAKMPSKLYVHRTTCADEPVLYFPRVYCNAMITMDDDHLVGYCKCSNCDNSINQFYKFCPECGAKLKSRIILGEDK